MCSSDDKDKRGIPPWIGSLVRGHGIGLATCKVWNGQSTFVATKCLWNPENLLPCLFRYPINELSWLMKMSVEVRTVMELGRGLIIVEQRGPVGGHCEQDVMSLFDMGLGSVSIQSIS